MTIDLYTAALVITGAATWAGWLLKLVLWWGQHVSK